MICSHVMSSNYFIESIDSSTTNKCKFMGRKWNASYEDAVNVLKKTEENVSCPNCPEMGFNASKRQGEGTFIVFTSAEAPYCSMYKIITEN